MPGPHRARGVRREPRPEDGSPQLATPAPIWRPPVDTARRQENDMTATVEPTTTGSATGGSATGGSATGDPGPSDLEARIGAFAERIVMATIGSFELATVDLGMR